MYLVCSPRPVPLHVCVFWYRPAIWSKAILVSTQWIYKIFLHVRCLFETFQKFYIDLCSTETPPPPHSGAVLSANREREREMSPVLILVQTLQVASMKGMLFFFFHQGLPARLSWQSHPLPKFKEWERKRGEEKRSLVWSCDILYATLKRKIRRKRN